MSNFSSPHGQPLHDAHGARAARDLVQLDRFALCRHTNSVALARVVRSIRRAKPSGHFSTRCARPARTLENVFRIMPPIMGPTIGASKPLGSNPWVRRVPPAAGAIVARIAIRVMGSAVLSSSNDL